MLSFFLSEMFPSIGFLSEWISLYPVFYTSSFAPCVRVLGGLKGEESRAKTREEEISHFTLLKLSFQKPAARCLQTARWGAGEVATLSGGTSWYLDAPQRALHSKASNATTCYRHSRGSLLGKPWIPEV